MSDRERVLDAFRNCITEPKCKDCPWTECSTLDNGRVEISRDLALAVMRELVAQEPRLVTKADFENADEYGFIPAWYEGLVNKEGWWNCIPKEALETAKEDGCRYWTSKPSLKQMEDTPWP